METKQIPLSKLSFNDLYSLLNFHKERKANRELEIRATGSKIIGANRHNKTALKKDIEALQNRINVITSIITEISDKHIDYKK